MANRLQRIMAMDQMMQNRNMPQQGMQSIFNPTTGTFVNVPFQTDPNFKGRRTVMTPSGPQALPGFQGQENPYRALGRGARNLLGNLFGRGQRRRQNRKADQSLQSQEEILRERYRQAGPDGQMNTDDDILPELVTKAATASPVVVKDGKGEITFTQERMPGVFKEAGSYENRIKQLMENQGINRGEAERNQAEAIKKGMDLDNSGYVDDSEAFAFNNPMTAGQPLEIPAFRSGREERLREIEERINRPILPSQNLPTFDVSQMSKEQVKYGDPKTFTLPNGDLAVSRTVTRGNQSGLEIIDPSSGRVIFSNAPGTTSSQTSSATPQANPFAKKMDREVDFEAAAFLSEAEAQKYVDPDITEQEFKRLNSKAKLLKARNVENLSFEEKEKVKRQEKRLGDLKTGEISREQNLKKAKEFLKAFEGEEKTLDAFGLPEKADSGADEAAKMMIPGVFSAQGRFNEEFNAFSYTAARAFLKAQGETRPTDADVEGARAALFGVGRDPQTNINLLQDYIDEQEKLLGLTKNKSTEKDFIVRTTDGKILD